MSRFDSCLAFVLEQEKAYSNLAGDAGGSTRWGVASNFWPDAYDKIAWLEKADKHAEAMQVVAAFYREKFWSPIQGDQLPPPLDLLVFDAAVNLGIGSAVSLLQQSINEVNGPPYLVVDGQLGAKTLAAVKAYPVHLLVYKITAERIAYYTSRPRKRRDAFLAGWVNRIAEGLESVAEGMHE